MIGNAIYNVLLNRLTTKGYGMFLERVKPGARILDIGVGNGLMLKRHHETIKRLGLKITGLDLDREYLKQCERLITKFDLDDQIQVRYANYMTEDLELGAWDVIFFSQSFMLIHPQTDALDRAKALLAENGSIVFFQTMQSKPSRVLEIVKPQLKYLTSIDFGSVTYDSDFAELLAEKELEQTERLRVSRITKSSRSELLFTRPVHTAVEA